MTSQVKIDLFGIRFYGSRKTRKLLKTPLQYFIDSKYLKRPIHFIAGLIPANVNSAPKAGRPKIHDLRHYKEETGKSIAVLVGFSPWKHAFIQDYLSEFDVVAKIKSAPDYSPPASPKLVFIVWGRSEADDITAYARTHNIPLWRMEDGFIRSVALGSAHSTPLSLVLDKQGIYFDNSGMSDLEHILQNHDFAESQSLMNAVPALINLVRKLHISKYNMGSIHSCALPPRSDSRTRILVIGQVEDDASLKYGDSEGWTNDRLIELALAENPDAEVFYRPHPDVTHGHRPNSKSLADIAALCTVLSEDIAMHALLRDVDHVYVMTSLSGFEALLADKKVTVTGAPFYAGWGLTDDRVSLPRRTRTLTLEQVFCAAYLLYPRYKNAPDAVTGCLSAMMTIVADREDSVHRSRKSLERSDHALALAQSPYWPRLLGVKNLFTVQDVASGSLFDALPLEQLLRESDEPYASRAFACMLAGEARSARRLRGFLSRKDMPDSCRIYIHKLLLDQPDIIAATDSAPLLQQAKDMLAARQLEQAEDAFNLLLLSGFINGDVMTGLANIASLKFDFSGAACILQAFNNYKPNWKAGAAYKLEAQAQAHAGNMPRALVCLSCALKRNGQAVDAVIALQNMLTRALGELPYLDALVNAHPFKDTNSIIGQAKGLIALGRAGAAEKVLQEHTPSLLHYLKHALAVSLAYSYQGKLDQSQTLVSDLLQRFPKRQVYREGARIAVLKNDYVWGGQLIDEAQTLGIDVGDMYARKIALGRGDIKTSYLTFRKTPIYQQLKVNLGPKYLESLDDLADEPASVCVLAFYGPGDEIRFASLYGIFATRMRGKTFTFTCDPRLETLLARSYPDLAFLPTARIRDISWITDYSLYNRLPNTDLYKFMDNRGWDLVQRSERVIPIGNLLGDVIEGYSSFPGKGFLVADSTRKAQWKERLAPYSGKKLVGISWRSTLSGYNRNEHYMEPWQLEALFSIEGIQFVNLQYDECSAELAWINTHFPNRIVHFADLDQFNDFEGVAALMTCLDLIISPATTVVELAGALGCPTLLMSNSSEMHWRKLPGTSTDVWQNSIEHVEGSNVGNKADLAAKLHQKVVLWMCKEQI
jgi:capsular polysaccharide export protein